MDKLFITVSGTYNSGKSTISHLIKSILKERGFNVSLKDVDGETDLPPLDYKDLKRTDSLNKKIEVDIEVKQLPRSANRNK